MTIDAILLVVVMIGLGALALPIAKGVAKGWLWLYTATAPKIEREARRAEISSDLHDQVADSRAEGHRPVETAIHILLRVVCGMKDDVAWAAPYLPSTLAEKLEKRSEALGNVRVPAWVVAGMATFGLMNWAWFMSEGANTWREWLLFNSSVVTGIVLLWKQDHPWVRRLVPFGISLMVSMMIIVLIWTVHRHRLYEIPAFNAMLLQVAVAMLPLILGAVAKSEWFRVRAFNGRAWPVYASWVLIAAVSLGIAIPMGHTVALTFWAAMASLVVGFAILTVIFTTASAAVCYGGLKGGETLMRVMAAGFRRLV